MGVDRLLDMIRTAVNITGDSAVTIIVAKSEGSLDGLAGQQLAKEKGKGAKLARQQGAIPASLSLLPSS